MASHARRPFLRIAAVALAAANFGACALLERPVPFETIDGPETPAILDGVRGRFAVDEGVSSICYPLRAIDPSRQQRCIPHLDDRPGWTAAIVPRGEQSVLRMRMASPPERPADGARLPNDVALETLTDCRRGEARCAGEVVAGWQRPPGVNRYHQTLSISPDGRRAAIVPDSGYSRGLGSYEASGSRFHKSRLTGVLKIVDLQEMTVDDTGIEVADEEPVSWSSDGRRLLVVRIEPVEGLQPRLAKEVVGHEREIGRAVPVVETIDLETRSLTMLAIGQQPIWSPDNRTLLYQPAVDRVELMDLVDFSRRPAALPGMSTRYEAIAIAFVASRKVLYRALPTTGATPTYTDNNSPLVGPKQKVTLKVADLDTGAFATVHPLFDPRARVGFTPD